MRTPVVTALVVATLALTSAVAGCAGDDSGGGAAAAATDSAEPSGPTSTESATPTAPPTSSSTGTPSAVTACDEVVEGIDDFNRGDLLGTVGHFELAVPLAEAEAAADPSPAADDLLEAVRYYAELPVEDYLQASASSPEFAKYQAITLGQCDGPTAPAPASSSGVTI